MILSFLINLKIAGGGRKQKPLSGFENVFFIRCDLEAFVFFSGGTPHDQNAKHHDPKNKKACLVIKICSPFLRSFLSPIPHNPSPPLASLLDPPLKIGLSASGQVPREVRPSMHLLRIMNVPRNTNHVHCPKHCEFYYTSCLSC